MYGSPTWHYRPFHILGTHRVSLLCEFFHVLGVGPEQRKLPTVTTFVGFLPCVNSLVCAED